MLKTHPCNRFGWLFVPAQAAADAMAQQLRLTAQEKEADIHFSGEPPGLFPWALQQLRPLVRDRKIAAQIEKRRETLQAQLDSLATDLQRKQESIERQTAVINADLALLDQLEGSA